MQDVAYLDARGYLTLPFSTTLEQLSPLTRNHKVRSVMAEVIGDEVGDALGRVYLRQRGTSTLRGVDGDMSYMVLPARTAVINTFFNGRWQFEPEVYRNERLRDRPLVNTGWDFILNRIDEQVNRDISIDGLKDIVLYLYYTDFTAY